MAIYILRRLLQIPLTLLVVSVVIFLALNASGDPARLYLPENATPEQVETLRETLGLNRPPLLQYGAYVSRLVRGDFGTSLSYRRAALAVVLEHLPRTLLLGGISLLLAVVTALIGGVISALRQGSFIDNLIVSTAVLGRGVPTFWLGLMLILLFSVNLRLLPTSGMGSWHHLVMPVFTYAWYLSPQILLITRAGLAESLLEDYVRTARSKGLPETRVIGFHVLRNSLVPVVAYVGMQIGYFIGGSFIIEVVFAWPGIGWLSLQGVSQRDISLVTAVVLITALAIALFNLLADVMNILIDPRISYS